MINYDNIKILAVDVDGVLTDGIYQMSSNGICTKSFYTKDFYGLELLLKSDIKVVIITQSDGKVIKEQISRIMDSNSLWKEKYIISYDIEIFFSVEDKKEKMEKYLKDEKISFEEVAYIGDSDNDLETMKECKFTACPIDAIKEIKEESNYISTYDGGKGAVYDICKHILNNKKEK